MSGEGWSPFVTAVEDRFRFLESHDYGPPRVSTTPRECTIVYWGAGDRDQARANVAVYHDRGSEPWIQIVPLAMTAPDGSTRSFGLNEAIAVLSPAHDQQRPKRKHPLSEADEHAWLDWYARFLEAHLDAVTRPSPDLLDAIEAAR